MTAAATSTTIHDVIRNVVLHVANEQPLVADLFGLPASSDAGLLCTNLRMTDGKRPVFIDDSASTFYFPYLVIRFLEIPPAALARHLEEGGDVPIVSAGGPAEGDRLPVLAETAGNGAAEEALDIELEIDEDFLQRIRDI